MSVTKKILLVDDEDDLRLALASQLGLYDEFETDQASTGAEALKILRENNFDLILLDVGLPDHDGREICRMARSQGVKTPIIMLTGADTDSDTILGLDSGANDYVTKPFKFPVLLARIRSHLRQFEKNEDATFSIGPYVFMPGVKQLIRQSDDYLIRLTEKETSILKYLLRTGGKSVGREELLDEVWGYNAGVTTHTLETHVYRLRQKIEENPSEAKILVTDVGGYRLSRA